MKGVIIAAGKGTRLYPNTLATNKCLLPIYDKPMILYLITTLRKANIKDILIITNKEHASHFARVLGNGEAFNTHIKYVVQEEAKGTAHALLLAEDFANGEPICALFGDNVIEDTLDTNNFDKGARIFLKEVNDPERFGIATLKDGRIVHFIEKPEEPQSNLACAGIYLFDKQIFDIIRTLKPSPRGEIELPSAVIKYLEQGQLDHRILDRFWSDAGTHDAFLEAANYAKAHPENFRI